MIVGEQIITDSNGNRKDYKMIQTEGANQMPDRGKIIKDLEFCVNGHFKVELSLATKVLALLKEQERLIEEARCEGYNEAYRSYCVEVAEEDREPIRYRYAVEDDYEGYDESEGW